MANPSFVSDLCTKYLLLAGLIFAGGSAYIAPALALFTADYLIQGRFFAMRNWLRFVLGGVCFMLAISSWALGYTSLIWPLIAFNLCAALSFVELVLIGKSLRIARS